MKKIKESKSDSKMYGINPHWVIHDEILCGKTTVVKNDKIKVKGERGVFLFVKYVTNSETGTDWVTCLSEETRQFRHFSSDRIKPVPQKRAKRNVGRNRIS